jgi:hypothetical protein
LLQVLLLPNFTMIVTAELRKCNGIDTVDLFEQVIFNQYLLLPVCAFNATIVFMSMKKSTGTSDPDWLDRSGPLLPMA